MFLIVVTLVVEHLKSQNVDITVSEGNKTYIKKE